MPKAIVEIFHKTQFYEVYVYCIGPMEIEIWQNDMMNIFLIA